MEFLLNVETIGQRLRRYIKAYHGTQTAFAKAVSMGEGQVSDYVRDEKEPGNVAFERFRADGMSIEWLLFGEGEMRRSGERSVTFDAERIMIIDIDNNRILTEEEARERLAKKEKERTAKK